MSSPSVRLRRLSSPCSKPHAGELPDSSFAPAKKEACEAMSDTDPVSYQDMITLLVQDFADEHVVLHRPRQVETEATLSLQHGNKVHMRLANVTLQLFERLDVRAMDEDPGFWERALVGWEVLLGLDYQPVAYSPELVREMAERHHFRQGLLPLYIKLWMAAAKEDLAGGPPAGNPGPG